MRNPDFYSLWSEQRQCLLIRIGESNQAEVIGPPWPGLYAESIPRAFKHSPEYNAYSTEGKANVSIWSMGHL